MQSQLLDLEQDIQLENLQDEMKNEFSDPIMFSNG